MDRDFARRPGRSNDYRLSRQERGTCHADYQDRLIEWKRTQAQRRELRHHNMKPRMISGTQINAMIRAILPSWRCDSMKGVGLPGWYTCQQFFLEVALRIRRSSRTARLWEPTDKERAAR